MLITQDGKRFYPETVEDKKGYYKLCDLDGHPLLLDGWYQWEEDGIWHRQAVHLDKKRNCWRAWKMGEIEKLGQRRKKDRYACHIRAKVMRYPGMTIAPGLDGLAEITICEIGGGGLIVKTGRSLSPGDELYLHFEIEGKPVEIWGTVLRGPKTIDSWTPPFVVRYRRVSKASMRVIRNWLEDQELAQS